MDDRTLPRIAVLGTGLMGRPMAGRLLAAGFPVTVWNRTLDKARPLADDGAAVAPSAAAAIRDADAVVLMLADAPAIRDTLLAGEDAGALAGRTVIQMGTIAPAESLELATAVADRGGSYLEGPVLGSIAEAATGRLVVMVGASPPLRALAPGPARVRPRAAADRPPWAGRRPQARSQPADRHHHHGLRGRPRHGSPRPTTRRSRSPSSRPRTRREPAPVLDSGAAEAGSRRLQSLHGVTS